MGWLGIDDTDSLNGGCTTEVFHHLVENLPPKTTIGQACLVRLWPFADRRTRGNAALAIELLPSNESHLLDHLDQWWHNHIAPLEGDVSPSDMSSREQHPASPGMVWFREKPPVSVYWAAVRGHVSIEDVVPATRSWGQHGRIGASAAAAWPGEVSTWEAIAWRLPLAEGQRRIDREALMELDSWPQLVFSRDPRRGKQLIAPRGNSPVLFGLRSRTAEEAKRGCQLLLEASGTEAAYGWRLFKTNQASGDHLTDTYALTVKSAEVHVDRKHVRLETDKMPVVMFAEGGPVNALGRWVTQGDQIEVRGLLHPDGSLHAEQARVLAAVVRRQVRPSCPHCGSRMKSMGANQGVRCPSCKHRLDDVWEDVPVDCPFVEWVEPHVDARRHLSRPLEWSSNP